MRGASGPRETPPGAPVPVAKRNLLDDNPPVTWEIAFVFAVLALVLAAFVREWLPAEVTALSAAGLFLASGLLSTEQVLAAFSNEGAVTVICMFVLAAGLEKTGAVDEMGRAMARWAGGSEGRFRAGLVVSAATVSAFINNTAVLLVFLPIALGFCRRRGVPPSRFLIPLSFASILGGGCTLVGTSTNLVVSGMARDLGQPPLGMFEMAPVGAVLALLGVLYVLFVAPRILPDRETFLTLASEIRTREYLTEAVVVKGSPLIGKRLRETPLARLADVRIIEIARGGEPMLEPIDSIVFAEGDRLLVKTMVSNVARIQDLPGLKIGNVDLRLQEIRTAPAVLVEGVIAPRSSLVGQTIRLANFRQRYNVLILAVHRQGENIRRKFEDVELRVGDVILMEGTEEAVARIAQDPDFLMLSDVSGQRHRTDKAAAAAGTVGAVVLLAAFGVLPIAALAFLGCLSLLLAGCLQPREAYRAVQWDTVLLIFGMLAVGDAFRETGAAAWIVSHTVDALAGVSPAVMLSLFYLATSVLTAVLSNNAVGILMVPVAVQTAQALGVEARPFLIATALAASLDFSTPIGYQTNTIVYSAGGYRFADFLKVGVPLNLVAWLAASVLIPCVFPLRPL